MIVFGMMTMHPDYFSGIAKVQRLMMHVSWLPLLLFVTVQVIQNVFPIIPGGSAMRALKKFVWIVILGKSWTALAYSIGMNEVFTVFVHGL
ncbi:hypothetical protein [Levilactobacillus parabrevis]|uniref:hypothetical protein n=1 Tax=Levilactobacillus parabrevis TaxID=357278 RepID=UPI0037568DAC